MKTPSMMMNEVLKKRAKKNKKGFSLVELIVVLVIMAILAAALVPTLIGYINQTRQSNAKNEASACVQAAQTLYSNAYASPDGTYTFTNTDGKEYVVTINSAKTGMTATQGGASADFGKVVAILAEVDDGKTGSTDIGKVNSVAFTNLGVVDTLSYTAANKENVSYASGKYTVGKASSSGSGSSAA